MPVSVARSSAHASPDFARALLQAEGLLWTTITSQSMTPLLMPGDRVKIQRFPSGRLRRGDLIALDGIDRIIVHRVVVVTRDGVLTKGDALPHADPPWLKASILGRVVAVQRQGSTRGHGGRSASALLGLYSLLLSRLSLRPSGIVWRLTRLPFYCLTRFE